MVTEKRVTIGTGFGLEIPVTDICTGLEKSIAWIQRKISEEMKTIEKNEKYLKLNS